MLPKERGWVSLLVDRLAGWWLGLPSETCNYTTENLRIPMGNEIRLAANLYRAKVPQPHGTILIRTPFGISPLMALGSARMFASRGYQVLHCSCRGTDPSDGQEVTIGFHELADGLATVSWMREQSWYTGSFGMFGGSYLGYTQWAILFKPPPDMKVAVINSGPHDFIKLFWGSGALHNHVIAWTDLMTLPKQGKVPGPAYIKKQSEILDSVYASTPLVDGLDRHFKQQTPEWLKYIATHPDLTDPFYEEGNHTAAMERLNIPVLQSTGWNDIGLSFVTEQYNAIAERGVLTYMTIGPWSHLGAQRGPNIPEGFSFIEKHLADRGPGFRELPVRVFVTGVQQWREFSSWPPSPNSTDELYFGSGHVLSQKPPSKSGQSSIFRFDPKNPTPATGLPRPFDDMVPNGYDDTTLAQRSDVAVFTSEPLSIDLEVLGKPTVELYHSSDNPHVDLMVRLSEVGKNGKSTRISEVYTRLDPERKEGVRTFNLSDCAHRFRKGRRIRVIITGGAHPAYIRNLGTGENPGTGAQMRTACHTIHHSVEAASKLRLPIFSTALT